ncbi:uncharacterized protein LOC125216009 [Salvia hispanica]|uniref:uncharacterized protein LOC125216009 n=1 Tax=Salvia hispanica TaxID=49212 RepID=UPI002009394F|nr:uncharacterized protein LOC125216009 [Salvia hispanica]XP_047973565.1 uncharacterized protein LOC125216009 [Salvia hispanica]XP_047973566.1 uncharacterized protein LOC125216009 [Salvia hispanica]
MQCSSYTPVYCHTRDLNSGAGGYSWHLYGEERGYTDTIFVPSSDQYVGYDKGMVKQIIQNHEATFRFQVQELHRLHGRQRDLMDEMRVRRHLLSQTSESIYSSSHPGVGIPHKSSPAIDWLLGNLSHRELSDLTSRNVQGPKHFVAESFLRPATLQSECGIRRNSSEQSGIVDLHIPAHMYQDDQVKQFKAPELTYRTPEKISDFQHATRSDFGSTKTWDLSRSSSDIRKTYCFIDLNEPIEPESLPTSSSDPLGAFTGLDIDLNLLPFDDEPIVQNRGSDSFLKTEGYIDLNSGVAHEHLAPSSSSTPEQRSLKGPVSPENEERSPPRGESEDIQLETSEEPFVELDNTTAAKTLVAIFSSGVVVDADVLDPLANFRNLCWFAEVVVKLETDATEENTLNSSRFSKRSSGKGQKRGKKGFKQGSAKTRKQSKLSMSSILKQSGGAVVRSWGGTRRRQGGRRRRDSRFLLVMV